MMKHNATNVTTTHINTELAKLVAGEQCVLFFHSPHCPPCKSIEKLLRSSTVRMIDIDVTINIDLALQLKVNITPTCLIYRRREMDDGIESIKIQGANYEALQRILTTPSHLDVIRARNVDKRLG